MSKETEKIPTLAEHNRETARIHHVRCDNCRTIMEESGPLTVVQFLLNARRAEGTA